MRGGKYLMEYSKSISNNRKDLKLTTGANVCKANNYSFGEILVNENYKIERQKLINKLKKRVEDRKALLQLKKRLLEQIEHDRNMRLYGYPFIEDGKSKRK